MTNKRWAGHGVALLTIVIWGTTFVATKVLLQAFTPLEILFFRFALGLAALTAVRPRRLRGLRQGQELLLALAGLCGICLYYLLENIALTCTLASNVGVIVAAAPLFTALLAHCFLREEGRLGLHFFLGLAAALAGVALISLQGTPLQLNPLGDLLALAAALVWACYSLLVRRISSWGLDVILTTRSIFAYGLLCMLPAMLFFDFQPAWERLLEPLYLGNLLFLGLGASALCFVSWNWAVKTLGAVQTSLYIYAVPVVTVVTAMLLLGERLTPAALAGIVLTLAGLLLSERQRK